MRDEEFLEAHQLSLLIYSPTPKNGLELITFVTQNHNFSKATIKR